MSCVDAKFGIGIFGTSRFDTLCTADGARLFGVRANIMKRKLDLYNNPKSPFKKKLY